MLAAALCCGTGGEIKESREENHGNQGHTGVMPYCVGIFSAAQTVTLGCTGARWTHSLECICRRCARREVARVEAMLGDVRQRSGDLSMRNYGGRWQDQRLALPRDVVALKDFAAVRVPAAETDRVMLAVWECGALFGDDFDIGTDARDCLGQSEPGDVAALLALGVEGLFKTARDVFVLVRRRDRREVALQFKELRLAARLDGIQEDRVVAEVPRNLVGLPVGGRLR